MAYAPRSMLDPVDAHGPAPYTAPRKPAATPRAPIDGCRALGFAEETMRGSRDCGGGAHGSAIDLSPIPVQVPPRFFDQPRSVRSRVSLGGSSTAEVRPRVATAAGHPAEPTVWRSPNSPVQRYVRL